ncbi:MAG: AGE family epimerase/isomerase [Parafilimonas sp.]
MNFLQNYKNETEAELAAILNYWMKFTVDKNGGFYGKINNENEADKQAPKGAVMHARILWAFSAAYNFCNDERYIATAKNAFEYIREYFIDKEFGGVFWTVDARGNMLDSKKQIYALAFCIYGLSEYYKASKNEAALALAIDIYNVLEEYSCDAVNKGYFEAFTREWHVADDLRLSEKDANEKKTMNTHLHIIEAYANLYRVQKNEKLCNKIVCLLELFNAHFIDHKTFHLKLFFDEAWNEKPDVISYGHDIEAAWLLQQCAEVIQNELWIKIYKNHAVKIAKEATEGLDKDGGMWYEYEPLQHNLVKQKHWWVQAEAMVGFYNAYQITNDEIFLKHSINSWQFVKTYIKDKKNGEWFWGVNEDYSIMQNQDKAGLWKCPYHNSRACLEIIKRINNYQ